MADYNMRFNFNFGTDTSENIIDIIVQRIQLGVCSVWYGWCFRAVHWSAHCAAQAASCTGQNNVPFTRDANRSSVEWPVGGDSNKSNSRVWGKLHQSVHQRKDWKFPLRCIVSVYLLPALGKTYNSVISALKEIYWSVGRESEFGTALCYTLCMLCSRRVERSVVQSGRWSISIYCLLVRQPS